MSHICVFVVTNVWFYFNLKGAGIQQRGENIYFKCTLLQVRLVPVPLALRKVERVLFFFYQIAHPVPLISVSKTVIMSMIMHVKDPQLSFVRVWHCVLLADFCLSLHSLHVLNRDVNIIQKIQKNSGATSGGGFFASRSTVTKLKFKCKILQWNSDHVGDR